MSMKPQQTSGNDNTNNLWPDLCQTNHVEHSVCKKESNNTDGTSDTVKLDRIGLHLVYMHSTGLNKYRLASPTITVLVPKLDMKPILSKNIRKHRRSDRIYVNFQETLKKNALHIIETMRKKEIKFKTNNIFKRNFRADPILKDSWRPKGVSKLYKSLLQLDKKELECARMLQAICKDVDSLKITANPEIDVSNNVIENNIVEPTLSLEIEDDKQDVKQEIIHKGLTGSVQLNINDYLMYSRDFREYCTNMLIPGFTNALETFLREIARLQKRYHERNPNKSLYKRRYYSGLKETRKHGELKKLKFVIVAPDIEKVELKGGLDDEVNKLLETCRKQNVTYGFGLSRRKMGYYTHGKGFVGCVGIANYSGTEEIFLNVLTELVHARNAFKCLTNAKEAPIEISKLVSDDLLVSEKIGALLKILSPSNVIRY